MKNFNTEIENIGRAFNKPPIFDGVVNEKNYTKSKIKILWVLKDPNSSGEEDSYDLRLAINDLKTENGIRKGWSKTFSNIVYVTNGILNNLEWDDIPYTNSKPEIIDELQKIAYINIKKVGGSSISNDKELQAHYDYSRSILLNQINEFKPDVVIFGNTYRFFKNDLGLNQMNKFGTCHATAKSDRIYIDAYHPNARISGENYFNDILKAYKIFKKQINTINEKTYPQKNFEEDINYLKSTINKSIDQIEKIEKKLLSSLKYEKLADMKIVKNSLEKIQSEIKNIQDAK